MTYGELVRILRRQGAALYKQGKRHEFWWVPATGRRTLVPRHRREIPTGTVSRIIKELGLEKGAD